MADLFKALKPKAQIAANGFDLSRKYVFSDKAGQAVPCLFVETVPDDKFEVDLASLTRTQTFNTAAFIRGKQRYDFFFVPYSQLWHPFNQFITQREDKHSMRQLGFQYVPVFNLGELLRYIYTEYDNEYETSNESKDIFGFSVFESVVRILDLAGYGDFRWILQLEHGLTDNDLDVILSPYLGKHFNIFRLAAYQHIWYDYYRNKYYDVGGSTGGIEPSGRPNYIDYLYTFNYDDVNCSSFANSIISPERAFAAAQMKYIQWKKDLFTSALPSRQFGVVSSVDLSFTNMSFTPTGESFSVSGQRYYPSSSELFGDLSAVSANAVMAGYSGVWSLLSAFDVLAVRKAEALQAWKQTTLRAGNMVDDSYMGHYGVKPYYEEDNNVRYLGSFSSSLQVNAVEATSANTGDVVNNRVGDLAATGTCVVNGSKLHFEVKDFGVIVCIASFLPESEYSSNSFDKANMLHEQFDFYTPEFQNIGLDVVTQAMYDVSKIQDSAANNVIGYAPRYFQYKTAVDKVFGEFHDTASMNSQGVIYSTPGTLKAWVSPRLGYTGANPSLISGSTKNIGSLYVDPRVYNNVFAINARADQQTDYFIHNVFFDIKAIRRMSVLGLPQF